MARSVAAGSSRCAVAGGELADRLLRQRAEVDFGGRGLLAQRGAQARHRGVLVRRSRRGHDQQRLAARAAGQEVQQLDRGLVGGVQILEREHDAAVERRLAQQVPDRGEHAMAADRPGRLRIDDHRRDRGERGPRTRRQAGDEVRAREQQRLERLDHGVVGDLAARGARAAAERVPAAPLAAGQHRLGVARLAHAGLADHQQRRSAALGGLPQRRDRLAQFAVAAEDRAREQPRSVDDRAAGELTLELERLGRRAQADAGELVAEQLELPRGREPVAGRVAGGASARGARARRPGPRASTSCQRSCARSAVRCRSRRRSRVAVAHSS